MLVFLRGGGVTLHVRRDGVFVLRETISLPVPPPSPSPLFNPSTPCKFPLPLFKSLLLLASEVLFYFLFDNMLKTGKFTEGQGCPLIGKLTSLSPTNRQN